MSFSRAPLSRFNEKNAQKAAVKVITPQAKDKTKSANSTGTPRSSSKSNLSRQRSSSSNPSRSPLHQQQPQQPYNQQPRARGRLGSQCSTQSMEVCESLWARNSSRSRSRDVVERSRTQTRLLSHPMSAHAAPDDGGGGGGGGGGGVGAVEHSAGGVTPAARQAQSLAQRRVLETQFTVKSRRFAALRKEVQDKHRTLADLHDILIDLQGQLQAAGVKEAAAPEALPWVDVEEPRGGAASRSASRSASRTPRRLRLRSVSAERGEGEAGPHTLSAPTEDAMRQLEEQLRAIPCACLEMCRDTLNKRNEVLNWFAELDSTRDLLDEEMRMKLDIFRQEGEATDSDMETAQGAQHSAVSAAVDTLRALAAAAERARAKHEAALSRAKGTQHQAVQAAAAGEGEEESGALAEARSRVQELETQLTVAVTELTAADRRARAATDEAVAEHERFRIVTDQLGLMDGYLKEERQHMRELESRLTSDEGRIQKVNAQMSSLEEQLRAREAAHEQGLKRLAEEARAQAETARVLEAHKEALERRVQDLGALLAAREGGDTNALSQMNELREEMEKELEKEKALRKSVQEELEKEKFRIKELEEKIRQLTEMRCAADNSADERCSALAQELETMKKQLRETLMKVASLEEERIIQEDAVQKIEARQHREREEQQRLRAELRQRDGQLREARAAQEALERQVAAARAGPRPLEKVLQQQQTDFQNKVSELQNALKEVVRHNDELERAVLHKQQEVEQRERVMREQAKVLKVRDELIVLLKSKEQRQEETLAAMRDTVKDDQEAQQKTSKELSEKAEELKKAYQALEGKQLQVTKLEALVKQLEEQQERAQAQRTRQEARISSLEMRLQAQGPAPSNKPPTPPKPASPKRGSPPSTFFFWDGTQLRQIAAIPPGAAQAPAQGTFYLTVTPKTRDSTASIDDPASVQFYVTANIGDVEEGRSRAEATEEAVKRAADAALAAYAAAAASTPPPAEEYAHWGPPADGPPHHMEEICGPSGVPTANYDCRSKESSASVTGPEDPCAKQPQPPIHATRSCGRYGQSPSPSSRWRRLTPTGGWPSEVFGRRLRAGSGGSPPAHHQRPNSAPPTNNTPPPPNTLDFQGPQAFASTSSRTPARRSPDVSRIGEQFSTPPASSYDHRLYEDNATDAQAIDPREEETSNQRWYPWTSTGSQRGHGTGTQQGDASGLDRCPTNETQRFPLFYPRPSQHIDGSRQAPTWFAFRSHTPPDPMFPDYDLAPHSYVTLPGPEFSPEDSSAPPRDVQYNSRLPMRTDPQFSLAAGSRMESGEGPGFEEVGFDFSAAVEATGENDSATTTSTRMQWGLATIDEVNSESRDQSENPTPPATDEDEAEASDTDGTRNTASAAAGEMSEDGGAKQPEEATDFDNYGRSHRETSDVSTDNPRSNADAPTTEANPATTERPTSPSQREDGNQTRLHQAGPNAPSCTCTRRQEDSSQNDERASGCVGDDATSRASNSGPPTESDGDSFVFRPKSTVRKCYSVFTTSSNKNVNIYPHLAMEEGLTKKTHDYIEAYHKSFSNINIVKNPPDIEAWNGSQNMQDSFGKVKPRSDTSVLFHPEHNADIQMSATLFDIQRAAGASDSNINSIFRRPSTSPLPRRCTAIENKPYGDKSDLSMNGFHNESPGETEPQPTHSSRHSNYTAQYYDHDQNSINNSPPDILLTDTIDSHSSNSRLLTPKPTINLSKYKPIRNIISKSYVTPEQKVRLSIAPHTHVVIDHTHKYNSRMNKSQQKKQKFEVCEHRSKHAHKPCSVPREVSAEMCTLGQIYYNELQNDSDTLSDVSCQMNQPLNETEDSYETDSLYTEPDTIYLSMQCFETCNCHGKTCKHIHW